MFRVRLLFFSSRKEEVATVPEFVLVTSEENRGSNIVGPGLGFVDPLPRVLQNLQNFTGTQYQTKPQFVLEEGGFNKSNILHSVSRGFQVPSAVLARVAHCFGLDERRKGSKKSLRPHLGRETPFCLESL